MSCKRLHVLSPGDPDPSKVVQMSVDGVEVLARTGESIAAAIVASGRSVFARSVKYHRPRGPYCFAARCEGCLMRVDGVPNVMTCATDVRDGARVETQNVIGSAERDLLSVTDWFFPEGMNHHEMFTATRALNMAMQTIARRVAGIGELPDRIGTFGEREQVPCDVAVVGGGVAGLLAAIEAARGGARIVLLEETRTVGGRLRETDDVIEDEGGRAMQSGAYVQALESLARSVGVVIRTGTSCVAIYEKLLLATDESHLLELRPSQIIIATGTHDATLPIRGSDLPNVYSLRAVQKLTRLGIAVGERVVMIREPALGSAPPTAAIIPNLVATYGEHEVDEILGRVRLRGLRLKPRVAGARPQLVRADAVVLAVHPVAEYELGAQAGAATRFDGHSFLIDASALDGTTACEHLRAVGECTGALGLARTVAQARRAGKRAAEEARRVR